MGVNELVLDIAFVSNGAACSADLRDIVRSVAQRMVPVVPRTALRKWKGSCEHSLIVIDGYALGSEGLALCRRLRLAGVAQPIVLAWRRDSDLDRAACREFGADVVVARPFAADGMLAVVTAAIGGRRVAARRMPPKPASTMPPTETVPRRGRVVSPVPL